MSKIIYTKTDEAPALATVSLLPILKAYSKTSGIKFETRDISLSSRILATFNDFLGSKVKYENDLEFLGKLVKDPDANIIKLPNISASIPQLKKAIKELQTQGFNIPDYPEKIENDNDLIIKSIYDKIKGSAVNPVLREGNSSSFLLVSSLKLLNFKFESFKIKGNRRRLFIIFISIPSLVLLGIYAIPLIISVYILVSIITFYKFKTK